LHCTGCRQVAHKGGSSLPVDLAQQAFGCLVPLSFIRRIQTADESLCDDTGADNALILPGEDALLIIFGEVGNGFRSISNPLVYLPLESLDPTQFILFSKMLRFIWFIQ